MDIHAHTAQDECTLKTWFFVALKNLNWGQVECFSKNNCVSEFTSQLFFYLLSCLHNFPPLFHKDLFKWMKKKLFCVKYLNVPKINCFLITEYNNDKNLFRKNSSNHDDFGWKKNWSHSVFLWQIEPKSTQTTLKPIHPIHLQPHQNQLFTLMKSQNQNTGDL